MDGHMVQFAQCVNSYGKAVHQKMGQPKYYIPTSTPMTRRLL